MKLKKLAKILVITSIVTVVGCVGITKAFEEASKVKPDYYSQIKTAPLEQKYLARGQYAVASQIVPSSQKEFKEYKIYYPQNIQSLNEKLPVIVIANGTGFPYTKFEPALNRLASWGFVVIANDEAHSWSGLSSSQGLALLDKLNADKNSVFFNKLNTQNAGIAGHSQGGVGAINGATRFANSAQFKAIYTASTTQLPIAHRLKWDYDPSKIRVPYFATAGAGMIDAGNDKDPYSGITTLKSMLDNSNKINSFNVVARRKGADHSELLYLGDGLMTAWFMWHLKGDNSAREILKELPNNPNWQDVKIKH